jgi:hypothetical protein
MLKIGLEEAIHSRWGEPEPHTYFRATEPIDGVWHSPNLEVISTVRLSFHKGGGDHRLVLVNIPTGSAIKKQEFCLVHPHAHRLSSGNVQARSKYLSYLKTQMLSHQMPEQLQACKEQATTYLAPEEV